MAIIAKQGGRMRIAGFEFRPGLWPTIATLAMLPLLIGLGNWQLERAAWKQGLIDAQLESTRQAPQPLVAVLDSGSMPAFRPVTVAGYYDLKQQLLLDNRLYNGQAGYHVLTPLQLAGQEQVVLVNRGWLPMGQSRAVLPDLPGPEQEISINGTITRLPEKVFRLDSAEERVKGWPQVIQEINFGKIEQRLGYALLPMVIQLDPAAAYGFTRDWKPVYGMVPDKHRAYAMQWFTLALVLALIYLGVNSKRIRN